MKTADVWIITASLVCIALGLALSFWPLIPAGIALLVLYGHTASGIALALMFDLLFGPPVGLLAFLHFPFLFFALACVLIRVISLRFVLERGALDAL